MTASGEAENWWWSPVILLSSPGSGCMGDASVFSGVEPGIGATCGWQCLWVPEKVAFSRSGHQLSLNGLELRKNYDKECISFLEVGKHRDYGCTRWGSLGVFEKYSRSLAVLWLKGRTSVSEPCMYYVYMTQMSLLFWKVFSRALANEAPLWHFTWQNTPAPSLIIM